MTDTKDAPENAQEESPIREADQNAMDVDEGSPDSRKRKAEAPVKRADPEPKKAKAGERRVN